MEFFVLNENIENAEGCLANNNCAGFACAGNGDPCVANGDPCAANLCTVDAM